MTSKQFARSILRPVFDRYFDLYYDTVALKNSRVIGSFWSEVRKP